MIAPVYLPEFNQTLKDAKVLAETPGDDPIYGLVINGGQIASSVVLHACYRQFLMEKPLDSGQPDAGAAAVYPRFREDHDDACG